MKGYLYLILLVAPAIALPAQGSIFSCKPNTARPAPETVVPGLLHTVKTDPSEARRAAAIIELRDFDVRLFPDIIPVLVDVLQNDTKPSVRREAAITLGQFPVTPLAGKALHEACSKDPSLKVRIHAWSAFKCYQFRGYHEQPTVPGPKMIATDEPPMTHTTVTYTPKTTPPAGPVVTTPPLRPQSTGNARTPVQATPVSTVPTRLPATSAEDDGPVLNPQK